MMNRRSFIKAVLGLPVVSVAARAVKFLPVPVKQMVWQSGIRPYDEDYCVPDFLDSNELARLWEPHRISLQKELADVRKRMMPWAEAARDYQEKLMSDIYDKWETTA